MLISHDIDCFPSPLAVMRRIQIFIHLFFKNECIVVVYDALLLVTYILFIIRIIKLLCNMNIHLNAKRPTNSIPQIVMIDGKKREAPTAVNSIKRKFI